MTTSEQENESLAQAREVLVDAREVLAAEQQNGQPPGRPRLSDREAAVAAAEDDLRERAARLDALISAADARDRAAEIRARSAEAREAAAAIRAERARLNAELDELDRSQAAIDREWAGRDRDEAAVDRAEVRVLSERTDPPAVAGPGDPETAAVHGARPRMTAPHMATNDHGTVPAGCAGLRSGPRRPRPRGQP